MNKEELAKMFHETYERLAPAFGWKTKKGCNVSFEQLPERNKALMVATCQTILAALQEQNNTAVALLNELSVSERFGRSVVSDKAYEIIKRWAIAQSLPQALTTGLTSTVRVCVHEGCKGCSNRGTLCDSCDDFNYYESQCSHSPAS
jgi:hypothetical protein